MYEEGGLAHSKSSNDLASASIASQHPPHSPAISPSELRSPGRRRRSTRIELDDPIARQKLFEEASTATALPDTFFSLHHESVGMFIAQSSPLPLYSY